MKGNIVAELNKVAAAAKPQDVFVLYYARPWRGGGGCWKGVLFSAA